MLLQGANPCVPHPRYENQTPLDLAKKNANLPLYSTLYVLTLMDTTLDASKPVGYFHPVAKHYDYKHPLLHAIHVSDSYAVRYLLEMRGVGVNREGMEMALEKLQCQPSPKCEEIVRLLMVHGGDIIPLEGDFPAEVQNLRTQLVLHSRKGKMNH